MLVPTERAEHKAQGTIIYTQMLTTPKQIEPVSRTKPESPASYFFSMPIRFPKKYMIKLQVSGRSH